MTRISSRPHTPPPPPPPPRKTVDNAVRAPELHKNKSDVPPPERYVQHEVQRGETMTEISHRYQTSVPVLKASNPQIQDANQLEVGQKVNVPIGADYGKEPTRDVVEPGQTLTGMAREHAGVSARDIARANRSEVPNSHCISPGQELWVPAQKSASPLEQKVQATDRAQAALDRAQQSYDTLPSNTNRAIRDEVHQGVQRARTDLSNAVREELDMRARQAVSPEGTWSSDEDRYVAAGAQLKERYQADEAATQQLDAALNGLAHERHQTRLRDQADAIVTQARNAGDAPQQMAKLDESLQAASPQVREAVTKSQSYKDLLQGAADWATEPLAGGNAQEAEKQHGMPQGAATAAAERLEHVTRGLSPELAAELTGKAMPTIETFSGSFKEHYGRYLHSPFMGSGFQSLMTVLDRGMDTPQGQANMRKLAAQDVWDRTAMSQHIAEGGRSAYALEWAVQQGENMDSVKQDIRSAMKVYAGKIDETAKQYGEHMSELGWLVANHGGAMTPEQLDQAIAQYAKDKGPEWEATADDLKAQLIAHGEKLAAQLGDLDPGADAGVVQEILSNPSAQLAFSSVVQSKPELLSGAQGEKIAGLFSNPAVQAKLGDQGRKMLNELATAYAKHTVLDKIGTLDPADPASVAKAKDALAGLKDSRFAKLLGLSSTQMDDVVAALEDTIPRAGESADDIARRMSALDEKLKGIKGLEGSTLSGQLMRGLGVALSGVGFLSSVGRTMEDPSVKNGLQTIVSAAGLGNRGSELLVAMGKVDADSAVGQLGSKAAGKLLGVLSAGFDVWNMGESFASGDIPSGVLYGTSAAGGLMATFGAGSLAGPIGIGLVLVSVIGLEIWKSVKEASKHEPGGDGGTSLRFLQNAGICENVAKALVDQSGEGRSPVPLLQRYAEHKGLDMQNPQDQQKFAQWLNSMPVDQLATLRDRLHHTLDMHDGDLEKFPASKPGDDKWKPVQHIEGTTEWGDTIEVNIPMSPHSAAQMDKMLEHLGLRVLTD